MATKTLHVGNLSNSSTEATLMAAFAAYGPTNARVVPNRGFGYVDVEEAQIEGALRGMDGRRIEGRPMTVMVASPSMVAGVHRNEGGNAAKEGR